MHALTGHVPGDGAVDALLAGNLVQLVNVDDALLGPWYVPVGGLDKAEQDVLNVLANIARFGERRGVADGKRHFQRPGQGFGQQRFARAGGPNQQDVGFLHFHVGGDALAANPLKMVVHCHRQGLLRLFLPNHVGVQIGVNFPWHDGAQRFAGLCCRPVGQFHPVRTAGRGPTLLVLAASPVAAFGHVVCQLADAIEANTAPVLAGWAHQPSLGKQAAAEGAAI